MSCYADPVIDIARAREWHLWDRRGRRYTDFCQAGGAAVLGHRPRGLSTVVKNEISRGVWAPVGTPWPDRIERAVRRLLAVANVGVPDRVILVSRAEDVLPAVESAGLRAALWRPFCDPGRSRGADLLLPVVPWPAPGLPAPVCAMHAGASAATEVLDTLCAVAPPVGAGVVRVLSLLATEIDGRKHDRAAIARGAAVAGSPPAPPPTIDPPPGYARNGAYCVRRGAEDSLFAVRPEGQLPTASSVLSAPSSADSDWRNVRVRAAESGMVFPACANDPFVIPGVLSDHERDIWRRFWSDA